MCLSVLCLEVRSGHVVDSARDAAMLKIYTAVSAIIAVTFGVADAVGRSTEGSTDTTCRTHGTVLCRGGTEYHWASALGLAAVALLVLLWVGWPIIIAGRIGKVRNRHGYLAGIFFGWLGLAWIVLRPARPQKPDWLTRAVQDYRARPDADN